VKYNKSKFGLKIDYCFLDMIQQRNEDGEYRMGSGPQ